MLKSSIPGAEPEPGIHAPAWGASPRWGVDPREASELQASGVCFSLFLSSIP